MTWELFFQLFLLIIVGIIGACFVLSWLYDCREQLERLIFKQSVEADDLHAARTLLKMEKEKELFRP